MRRRDRQRLIKLTNGLYRPLNAINPPTQKKPAESGDAAGGKVDDFGDKCVAPLTPTGKAD